LVLEDKFLIWKFRHGSSDALCRIYEKYRDDLLRLASSLAGQRGLAEDIVHDVFISFVRSAKQFQLTGSLKNYLAVCVANRARNVIGSAQRHYAAELSEAGPIASDAKRPEQWVICSEELEQLNNALGELPYEQREVIILHLQAGMRFREIAAELDIPAKTAQSRFRYGLNKLRSILDGQVI